MLAYTLLGKPFNKTEFLIFVLWFSGHTHIPTQFILITLVLKSILTGLISSLSPAGGFKLEVERGEFSDSEIIVMLGENGTGKTTFIKMLAGIQKPTNASK